MKGLEAVKKIRYMIDSPFTSSIIKQGLNVIEKELKALEIIKRKIKEADIVIRKEKNYCYAWYYSMGCILCELTESEYDLLEEEFNNDK